MQPLYDALRDMIAPEKLGPLSGKMVPYRLPQCLFYAGKDLGQCICGFWMKRRTLPCPDENVLLTRRGKKCKNFLINGDPRDK